jgi:hypothetical protein
MAFKDFDITDHLPSGFQSTLGSGTFSVRGSVGVDGLEEVKDNLRLLIGDVVRQSTDASSSLAHKILEKAKGYVPYRTGDLFNTGKVTGSQARGGRDAMGRFTAGSLIEFFVSFGGDGIDYALFVHENPDGMQFVQNPPNCPPQYRGEPKISHYLSVAADQHASEFPSTVSNAVQEAMVAAIARAKTQSMRPRLVKRT